MFFSIMNLIWVSSLFETQMSSLSRNAIYLPVAFSNDLFLAQAGPLFFPVENNLILLSFSRNCSTIFTVSSLEQSSVISNSQLRYV